MTEQRQKFIVDAFTASLTEAVATTSGIDLRPLESSNKLREIAGVFAQMCLFGENNVMAMLFASRDDMSFITAAMTGLSAMDLLEPDICDCAAELLNMTAGSAKQKLMAGGQTAFSLSTPVTIFGECATIYTKRGEMVYTVDFAGEELNLTLSLILL